MFQSERKMLDKFLQSLKFPLAKNALITQAEQAGLPVQFMGMLQRLEDRQFKGVEDVEETLAVHKA